MDLLSYLSSSGFAGGAGDLHVILGIYRWILLGFYTQSLDFVKFFCSTHLFLQNRKNCTE